MVMQRRKSEFSTLGVWRALITDNAYGDVDALSALLFMITDGILEG